MSQRDTADADLPLPLATRHDAAVQGHWLLARLGKRVLRPGGAELTHKLLALADLAASDVVELAPGLGRTAAEIIHRRPRSYVGVEQDPNAAARSGRSCPDTATPASPTRPTPGYPTGVQMLWSARRC